MLFLVISITGSAQIYVLGNTLLKRQPLKNVQVTVKKGDKTVMEFNTGTKNEFTVELDYGPNYKIYLQHPDCATMYATVKSDDVPPGKYEYRMKYAFDANFTAKTDTLKDTLAYRVPFHKIKFDGRNRMIDDATWNTAFILSLEKKGTIPEDAETLQLKKEAEEKLAQQKPATPVAIKKSEEPTKVLAGRILVQGNKKLPVANRALILLDASGNNVQSGMTNRLGSFIFTGIKSNETYKILMDSKDGQSQLYTILDESGKEISRCENKVGQCEFLFDGKNTATYSTDEFTSTIGGKMVITSGSEKTLYADKKVFLTDMSNKVLSETKTNILGTFVFEGVQPGKDYIIGVDHKELKAGEKIDILSKEDIYIATLDTTINGKPCMKLSTSSSYKFAGMAIDKDEIRMQLSASVYGNDVQHPISNLKILLLSDNNEIIDSTITDQNGFFNFKHLPYLKSFYLSADNNQKQLDGYNNILLYSKGQNLVKMMPFVQGKKFQYKMLEADIVPLKEMAIEDPWLDFLDPTYKSKVNNTSITENILFESNSSTLNQQAKAVLDKIILVLKSNSKLRIQIGAHTDSRGNDVANLKLSQQRAASVSLYMVTAGIDQKRIAATGYGESKLLNNCTDEAGCTDIEHAINRRIEFKIIGE